MPTSFTHRGVRPRRRQGCPLSPLGGSGLCSQTRKRNERHGKEDVKWSLFVDDMIIYIEKLKKSIKKAQN